MSYKIKYIQFGCHSLPNFTVLKSMIRGTLSISSFSQCFFPQTARFFFMRVIFLFYPTDLFTANCWTYGFLQLSPNYNFWFWLKLTFPFNIFRLEKCHKKLQIQYFLFGIFRLEKCHNKIANLVLLNFPHLIFYASIKGWAQRK